MKRQGVTEGFGGALCALLLLFACRAEAQEVPLRFAPGVVRQLSALYTHYAPDEYVACLRVDSTGVVTGFDIPPQKRIVFATINGSAPQRALQVDADACQTYGSTVRLHSHPATDRDSLCFLPPGDIWTFSRSQDTHVAIICRLGVLWWNREQVKEVRPAYGGPAYAVPGQFAPFAEVAR